MSDQTKPRPRRIHGVTVQPRWDWSPEYLQCVRDTLRNPRYEIPAHIRDADRAERYRRWKELRDAGQHDLAALAAAP